MMRWPLHPAPLMGEALSSWLRRIAEHNGVDVPDLLADLGFAPDAEVDVDLVPPPGFVDRVAQRTGVSAEHVRLMSAAGYVPWLADSLSPDENDFSTYVRQFSVLLFRMGGAENAKWSPGRPGDPRVAGTAIVSADSVSPRRRRLITTACSGRGPSC